MIECQNCGEFVTEQYVRVFTPEEYDRPRACPNCPDMTRGAGGRARERRSMGGRQ